MSNTVLLIDGSNYLFRAFHGLPDLRTSQQEPTGAMRGFFGMLGKVWNLAKPDRAVIVFDAPGKNFRHEKYPDYKANRPPMPDDLRVQIEPLLAILKDLGWPLVSVKGVEADDVIATLAEKARAQGMKIVIATGDKDMAQLVDEDIRLLNTMNIKFYDKEGVKEKYGVYPDRIIDYLALMGDKVDNVPGIEKCGPKTAAKWIDLYGDLDGVKTHADEVKGKVGEYLREGLPFLDKARELVTIKRDCELPEEWSDPAKLNLVPANREKVTAFCQRWEMSISTILHAAPVGVSATPASAAEEGPAQGSLFDAPAETPAHEGEVTKRKAVVMPTEVAKDELIIAPDEIPFTKVDSPIALQTLVEALEEKRTLPVGLQLAFTGEARHAKVEGLVVALSAKDIYVYHERLGLSSKEVLDALAPWLSADTPKVAHDAKTIRHALRSQGIEPGGRWDDTMLMSYVLEAHLKHELPALSRRYLKRQIPLVEEVLGKGAKAITPAEADVDQLEKWLSEEGAAIRALSSTLYAHLAVDEKLKGIYERIERPLLIVLDKMETNGVAIDSFKFAQESDDLTQRLKSLEEDAYRLAGKSFNLSSPKQLGTILFTDLKLPVIKKTATGSPSTDEEVLNELALDYPLPKVILEYRMIAKLLSTYIDKLPKMLDAKDGRLHTTFGQATAVTGRLASSEPNLQNIPVRTPEGRRVREGFVAKEGCQILSADYSQIELRIMAHLSGDEELLKAFSQGRDVHKTTAASVFNKTVDEVTADERRMAKVINFGLIYGMSPFGLAQNLGIDRKVAEKYVQDYFARYPGVKRYMEEKRAECHENGFVETEFGRRLWIPDINASRKPVQAAAERAAINAPMQGTAADLIKLAMIAVENFLEEGGYEAKLILQVHDELILEVPETEVKELKDAVPRLMAEVASLKVPLIAEVGVGASWEEAH